MNALRMILPRLRDNGNKTLGRLTVLQDDLTIVGSFTTLEPPWKGNQHKVSCIPPGLYVVAPFESPSKGPVLLLENVPDRSMIELHRGNDVQDTEGCILIGTSFITEPSGNTYISESAKALNALLAMIKAPTQLRIIGA